MAKPKPAPLPAGTAVGGYQVISALASGGTGVVYQALSPQGQAVLLKEFLPGVLVHRSPGDRTPLVRPGQVSRLRQGLYGFLDGARVLAQMQHPGLASVLDAVACHETVYLVLRHLQGRTLQDLIVAARPRTPGVCLSEATVTLLALELLQALAVVHEVGLLHLDIKPSNVLIAPDGHPVLLDFDAVQPIPGPDGAATPVGLGFGLAGPRGAPAARPAYTPGFTAPETMAHSASLGPWTDLYAVGACLFAALTGHPPPHCLSRAQDDTVPRILNALSGHYSSALLQVVERTMSLGIAARPASVAAMQALLAPAAQSAAAALDTSSLH